MKETSKQAYHKIKSDLSRQQGYLMVLIESFQKFCHAPMISENLFLYDEPTNLRNYMSYEAVKKRMGELEKLGLVKDSGKRAKTSSGRNAIVWEVVK